MPIGSESDRDIIRPKHQMVVPGARGFYCTKHCRAPVSTPRLYKVSAARAPKGKQTCALPNSTTECHALPTLLPSQASGTVQTLQEKATFAPPSEDTQFMTHIRELTEIHVVIDGSLTKKIILRLEITCIGQ